MSTRVSGCENAVSPHSSAWRAHGLCLSPPGWTQTPATAAGRGRAKGPRYRPGRVVLRLGRTLRRARRINIPSQPSPSSTFASCPPPISRVLCRAISLHVRPRPRPNPPHCTTHTQEARIALSLFDDDPPRVLPRATALRVRCRAMPICSCAPCSCSSSGSCHRSSYTSSSAAAAADGLRLRLRLRLYISSRPGRRGVRVLRLHRLVLGLARMQSVLERRALLLLLQM